MNRQRWTRRGIGLIGLLLLSAGGTPAAGQQPGQSREGRPGTAADYDEDGQPTKMPPLPSGMTLAMIREGDSLFRGKGGCVTCHGAEAEGVAASGSSLRSGLHFIPYEWAAIDSVINGGISEPMTRSPVAMPARGAQSNLTPEESRRIAAYVWAISQVRGEPWAGGHQQHGGASQASQPSR